MSKMANIFLHNPNFSKATLCLLFLITTFLIANSARILNDLDSQPQAIGNLPGPGAANPSIIASPVTTTPQIGPATTLPSGQTPAATVPETEAPAAVSAPVEDIPPPVASPATDETPVLPQPEAVAPSVPDETPVTTKPVAKEPSFPFFMHDTLGGSHPSVRVMTGIVANSDVTGLPFSKLNNNLFPITGGIPLVHQQQWRSILHRIQKQWHQVTSLLALQSRSSVTVVDDQLTEGHELDSTVIGRAQGFYMASSLDGTSQTIVLTVLVHGSEHHEGVEDTISLFGVHRTASPESEIAVIGGTGKYENAALETLLKEDQHTTDGVDTILHFNICLTE